MRILLLMVTDSSLTLLVSDADRCGRNEMGKLYMKLRDELINLTR